MRERLERAGLALVVSEEVWEPEWDELKHWAEG